MKSPLLPLIFSLAVFCAACTPMEEKRDAHLEKARSESASGNYAAAIAEAKAAVELDPASAEAYRLIGFGQLKSGKEREAEASFTEALKLKPDYVEALEQAARAALILGEPEKGKARAEKALALGSDTTENAILRAGALMKLRKYALAVPLLEKALENDPKNEEAIVGLSSAYVHLDQKDKASALLSRSLNAVPESTSILSLLATMAVQRNEPEAAEKYINSLIALKPDDAQIQLQLSDLRLLAGKPDEAINVLRSFLQKHPEADVARVRLAALVGDEGNFDKALEELNAAPTQNGLIRLHKASLLGRAGKLDEAIASLKALAADSAAADVEEDARFGLVEIYRQKNMNTEAVQELNTLIGKNPENTEALTMRGRLAFIEKNFEAALRDFERVQELRPDDPYAALSVADAYNASGDTPKAEGIITSLLEKDPSFAQAYISMANLYLMQGKAEAALMTLGIGKRSAPGDASIPLTEADVLAELKRYDKAVETLAPLTQSGSRSAEAALMKTASILGSAGKHTKAAESYKKVLDLNPESTQAAEGFIRASLSARKNKEAFDFAEKRFKERPNDAAAAFMVAETAFASGNRSKAEPGLVRAVELAPQWDQPLTMLVQLYNSQGKQEKAMEAARAAAEKAPDALAPVLILALLEEQNGNMDSAEQGYRKVLALSPEDALASNNLAALLCKHKPDENRLREALALANTAIKSGQPTTLDTLGWVQHLLGSDEEAERNIREAHDKDSTPVVDLHLATTLSALAAKPGISPEEAKAKREEAKALLIGIIMIPADVPQKADARKVLDEMNKK